MMILDQLADAATATDVVEVDVVEKMNLVAPEVSEGCNSNTNGILRYSITACTLWRHGVG